jgi:predicted ribosome quality control (RQC) complex YloA/Tae2 family protein
MKLFYYNYSQKKIIQKTVIEENNIEEDDIEENDIEENDIEENDIIIPIKIGQNAKQNKELIDEANQNDLWFHIDNLPSPHGIIYISESNLSTNDIIKDKILINIVANLVRDNSKYKNQKMNVIYCPIKNISHGDKIGSVILKSSPKSIKI